MLVSGKEHSAHVRLIHIMHASIDTVPRLPEPLLQARGLRNDAAVSALQELQGGSLGSPQTFENVRHASSTISHALLLELNPPTDGLLNAGLSRLEAALGGSLALQDHGWLGNTATHNTHDKVSVDPMQGRINADSPPGLTGLARPGSISNGALGQGPGNHGQPPAGREEGVPPVAACGPVPPGQPPPSHDRGG